MSDDTPPIKEAACNCQRLAQKTPKPVSEEKLEDLVRVLPDVEEAEADLAAAGEHNRRRREYIDLCRQEDALDAKRQALEALTRRCFGGRMLIVKSLGDVEALRGMADILKEHARLEPSVSALLNALADKIEGQLRGAEELLAERGVWGLTSRSCMSAWRVS